MTKSPNGSVRGSRRSAYGHVVLRACVVALVIPGFLVMWATEASGVSTGTTALVSVSSSGAGGNQESWTPSISSDGRYVAFESGASNLVPGDTNSQYDVFVRDRRSGTTERVSVSSGGAEANDVSSYPSISADGRYVAFESYASNLVADDTNASQDIFVRDRVNGTTERVSVSSAEVEGNNNSFAPSIDADGSDVAFWTYADNIDGVNHSGDVFVRDRVSGTTERISQSTEGEPGDFGSITPSISANGRYVAFASGADNLVEAPDYNGGFDIFVRDRVAATTARIAHPGVSGGENYDPAISGDGNVVAFWSNAAHLVTGDDNGAPDIFVYDRGAGTTERVSGSSAGVWPSPEVRRVSLSADGRYVTFESSASDLVTGDTNGTDDVFVRDRQTGTVERVNLSTAGAQADAGETWAPGTSPAISPDGRFVAFSSGATNLVTGDTNGREDIFVRDRFADDTAPPTSVKMAVLPRFVVKPAQLSWSAVDTNSGVDTFDVQRSTAKFNQPFGAYATLFDHRRATSATTTVAPGTTVCFQVRARDYAGNVSKWTKAKCTAAPIDDRSFKTTAGWTDQTGTPFYQGTYRRAAGSGQTLTKTGVRAHYLALYATTGPSYGAVDVLWNGTVVGHVDLYAAAKHNTVQFDIVTFASVQTGTLKIVTTTTKIVQIDAAGASQMP